MTPRESFMQALRREKIVGQVPHFELVFFLTMEAIGRIHPIHRNYGQWHQMSRAEQRLHLVDMALSYIEIAEKCDITVLAVKPAVLGGVLAEIKLAAQSIQFPGITALFLREPFIGRFVRNGDIPSP